MQTAPGHIQLQIHFHSGKVIKLITLICDPNVSALVRPLCITTSSLWYFMLLLNMISVANPALIASYISQQIFYRCLGET